MRKKFLQKAIFSSDEECESKIRARPSRKDLFSSDEDIEFKEIENQKERLKRALFTSEDESEEISTEVVDLTGGPGLIVGSDKSSEINSLHSSDIDFIDDTIYEISSEDDKQKRSEFNFKSLFRQIISNWRIQSTETEAKNQKESSNHEENEKTTHQANQSYTQ